jgi:uncharacterized OsmC-like protein
LTATSEAKYTRGLLRNKHELVSDEPEWLPNESAGDDDHPAPVDFLLMSLASCQTSALQQCLQRNGIEEYRIVCEAVVDKYETDNDHPEEMPPHTALRIDHVTVTMTLETTKRYETDANRCLMVYDEGCIVGQSLQDGIEYTSLTSLEIVDSPIEADGE